ncbi:MAG TPA: hypothetical protein VM913_07280 [Sphingomicrobium sp.]|jgi:hypothetical protein|nr:hypothetical protein [Sphingomicrobium sp.]
MRNIMALAAVLISLSSCRPAGDQTESRDVLAEAGAPGPAPSTRVSDPIKSGAEKATPESLPDNLALANTSQSPSNEVAAKTAPVPAVTDLAIPARYQGRWGMVPADCTSTRGDAKGLITIDGRTIRFFESVATMAEQRVAIATSFSGRYTVTGEGMEWERVITLTRAGDTLTRADEDGRFTYTRCPA